MKRDMDLVRQILIEAEAAEPGAELTGIDGVDPIAFAQHVELMEEAGLVNAAIARASGVGAVKANVERLTWDGHDFLSAVRSDSVWSKTKERLADAAGSAPLDAIKSVAIALMVKAATQQF